MHLLVCSNGLAQAESAIRFSASIATACGARVTLLGIAEREGDAEALQESLERGLALLRNRGIEAQRLVKAGHVLREIKSQTDQAAYDLVIVGMARKEIRGRLWMAPKAYKIIKEIKLPVLLVVGKPVTLHRVLVCSSGGHYIDNAVRLAGQLARCTGASVTLFHAMPSPPAIYAQWPRAGEDAVWLLDSPSELGRNLRLERETLASLGVSVQVRLRQGSVLEEIQHEIDEGRYDLVVIGTALDHGLRTYVLGDLSREIMNRVNCSILVARSTAAESE